MLVFAFPVLGKDSDVLRDETVIVWEELSNEGVVSDDSDSERKRGCVKGRDSLCERSVVSSSDADGGGESDMTGGIILSDLGVPGKSREAGSRKEEAEICTLSESSVNAAGRIRGEGNGEGGRGIRCGSFL
jgi:hypothetical protein